MKTLFLIVCLTCIGLSHEGKHKHFHYHFVATDALFDSLENAEKMDYLKYDALRDSSIKFLAVHNLKCFFHWSDKIKRILPNNLLYRNNQGLQDWFKLHPECLERIRNDN